MKSVTAQFDRVSPARPNLLDLDRQGLEAYFSTIGEKSFRASQVAQWLHQKGVTDFQQMTNLSQSLRDHLQENTVVDLPEVVYDATSADGTRKWLLQLQDGNRIETVYIPENDRGTLCVSSQVGCALDCSFCSTGRSGFNRNLSTAEIISQVWLATRLVDEEKKPGRSVTNVVLMGMGEPLLNYDNVVRAVRLMMDDFAYGLSKRRVNRKHRGSGSSHGPHRRYPRHAAGRIAACAGRRVTQQPGAVEQEIPAARADGGLPAFCRQAECTQLYHVRVRTAGWRERYR